MAAANRATVAYKGERGVPSCISYGGILAVLRSGVRRKVLRSEKRRKVPLPEEKRLFAWLGEVAQYSFLWQACLSVLTVFVVRHLL